MTSRTQESNAVPDNKKTTCPSCGGSGQVSMFKGVSRFLLSTEECPECAGIGYVLPDEDSSNSEPT